MAFAFKIDLIRAALFLSAVILCSNCSSPAPEKVSSGLPDGAWWNDSQASGSPKIVISLDEQRVALFKGDQAVGLSPISSGREGHDTHVGTFRISEKDENHRSSLYGAYVDSGGQVVVEDVDVRKDERPPGTSFVGADMHWFMRINGAIGMHRGYLPGYPASHGCIRLPGSMASLFFHATPHGTPVEIRQNASLLALQRQEPPSLPVSLAPAEVVSSTPAQTSTAAANSISETKTVTEPSPQPKPKPKAVKPKKSNKAPRGTTLYWDGQS